MRMWIALAALSACGNGSGAVSGTVEIDPCYKQANLSGAYNLNPDYFVADMIYAADTQAHPQNKVMIRVQHGGRRLDEADGIYINIAQSSLVANQLSQDVGPATNLRASLVLNASCPDHPVEMELDGTITFTSFGSASGTSNPETFKIGYGDHLAANFTNLTIVDRRAIALGGQGSVPTAPQSSGTLTGNFDFVVQRGRGAQLFP
jgi:hypothetical protein